MDARLRVKNVAQRRRGKTAWSLKEALVIRVWEAIWFVFLRWTPKNLNRLRLFALRLFGAKINGTPFVSPSARIYAPFNLEIMDNACVGPNVNVYNLGRVVLGVNSVVSLGTMLCGGTHDLTSYQLPLLVGDIVLGNDVFVGAKAMILPSVRIGDGAVVGAYSLVAKDVSPWTIVGGNPAKVISKREMRDDDI